MCGICGIWEYGATRGNIDRDLIVSMRDAMTHRGPDDAGDLIFDDTRGGFGFRRLSIIDLSRAGVKPLYYYHHNGRFMFASEIKALLQHPAVTPEINEEALYHYLTFVTTSAPQTLFQGVHKIPAGHMLVIDREGEFRLKQYWDALPAESSPALTESEHQQNILNLLRDSIRKRMMADRKSV